MRQWTKNMFQVFHTYWPVMIIFLHLHTSAGGKQTNKKQTKTGGSSLLYQLQNSQLECNLPRRHNCYTSTTRKTCQCNDASLRNELIKSGRSVPTLHCLLPVNESPSWLRVKLHTANMYHKETKVLHDCAVQS